MLTALASAFTQRKVQPHLAMTGEITRRGKVLPVGGIKEKILAARRADIKAVILCKNNKKDIEEIKQDYKIGRASRRERVCQYVKISVVAVSLKKKSTKQQQNKETQKNNI